jgi:hypothetical protein
MSELLLERSPEAEIYGRSLSTVHRLGALMVKVSLGDAIASPEADQARVEFFTSVEEGFGTDMELGGGLEVRDFDKRPVVDGKVMSKDLKTAISSMTEAGVVCARHTARFDSRFQPQLVRSEWDHENALEVDRMTRGETDYNTRIVMSPFPEEAAAQTGSDFWRNIGYVPHLRRGFVQLYHWNGAELVAGSLSFDGSDKIRLRSILEGMGIEVPEDETTDNWLKYAVTGLMTEGQAKQFAVNIAEESTDDRYKKTTNTVDVTRKYEAIMDRVFDESYVHVSESLYRGYQTDKTAELVLELTNQAKYFNSRYTKSLYKMRANRGNFSDEDSIVLHELLVYSAIEMMRALHKDTQGPDVVYTELNPAHFQRMLSGFGAEGARNNRTYSACGLAISAGDEGNGLGDALDGPQSVFGGLGRDGEETVNGDKKKWTWKPGVCVVPKCPTRPGKTIVGPCSICKCCQLQFDMGKNPAKEYKYMSN